MTPIAHIRKNVLKLTQLELAALAGTRQATVSRWEKGELEPSREQMAAIRAHALKNSVPWHDEWFFVLPATTDTEAA